MAKHTNTNAAEVMFFIATDNATHVPTQRPSENGSVEGFWRNLATTPRLECLGVVVLRRVRRVEDRDSEHAG